MQTPEPTSASCWQDSSPPGKVCVRTCISVCVSVLLVWCHPCRTCRILKDRGSGWVRVWRKTSGNNNVCNVCSFSKTSAFPCHSPPLGLANYWNQRTACFVKWISGSEKLLWFERAIVSMRSLPAILLIPSYFTFFSPVAWFFFFFSSMPRKQAPNPAIVPHVQRSDLSGRVTGRGNIWAPTVHDTHTHTRCQDLKFSAWLPESDFLRVHTTTFPTAWNFAHILTDSQQNLLTLNRMLEKDTKCSEEKVFCIVRKWFTNQSESFSRFVRGQQTEKRWDCGFCFLKSGRYLLVYVMLDIKYHI